MEVAKWYKNNQAATPAQIEKWREQFNEDYPYLPPELMSENRLAWEVWNVASCKPLCFEGYLLGADKQHLESLLKLWAIPRQEWPELLTKILAIESTGYYPWAHAVKKLQQKTRQKLSNHKKVK